MNLEKIKEVLDKIPFGLLLFLYLGYLGYDYYSFINDADSVINVKKKEIEKAKETKAKIDVKLREANKFVKTLEVKKLELRNLANELQNMKESLSERADVPAFMKMLLIEAKKIGVTVNGLRPAGVVDKEFYSEMTYKMSIRGIFMQVGGFLDRLSNVAEILRVEDIDLRPVGSSRDRFVLLEGTIGIKTYKYKGSNADNLGKAESLTGIETDRKGSLVPKGDPQNKLKGGA